MFNRAKPITFKMPVLQTPESFKGGSFKEGFFTSYAPFLFSSIITILITSFDLVTDWFAFKSIQQLHLSDRFKNRDTINLQDLYIALPHIFLAFCILASIIYAIDVIHFVYKFIIFRRKFFDVRDGINGDGPLIERFSGEGCMLLLVIFEDLPLSLLILAVQAVVSCRCLLIVNKSVFYVCIVATCISIVWKLLQVLWSTGCCGKRTEYESGKPITIFRILSACFLFCALGVTILNSILIKPDAFLHLIHHRNASKNTILDKVYIEKWLEKESVVFMEKMEPMDDSQEVSKEMEDPSMLNIVLLSKILNGYDSTMTVNKKCSGLDNVHMNITNYMAGDKRFVREGVGCTVLFQFHYEASEDMLFYDYGYRLTGRGVGSHCRWGRFNESYHKNMTFSDRNAVTPQSDPSSPADIFNPVTRDAKQHTVNIAHSILFMSGMTEEPTMYKACDNVKIAHRKLRSFDPCASVVTEQ